MEYHHFMEIICKGNLDKLSHVHFGAITRHEKSLNTWFWMNSGNRIPFSLAFLQNEPNNANNNEYCLILTVNDLECKFNDVPCDRYYLNLVCQKFVASTSF